MEWNFDPSIYKRLEGIRARSQYPRRGKHSIWIDRSTATRQSENNGDHCPISGSELSLDVLKCDITIHEERQDGHIRGMKATLQSRCDLREM